MKTYALSIATALAVMLSMILLCTAMQALVVRHENILLGAAVQLPVTRSKGVALLMLDASRGRS